MYIWGDGNEDGYLGPWDVSLGMNGRGTAGRWLRIRVTEETRGVEGPGG